MAAFITRTLAPRRRTSSIGGAAGAAAVPKRFAVPSAKIMIHQGSAGARGALRDMEIHLREVLATTKRMAQILAHHTGRPVEQVEQDIDRDYYMTAYEAREYGLVDDVIAPRRGVSAELIEMAEATSAEVAREAAVAS